MSAGANQSSVPWVQNSRHQLHPNRVACGAGWPSTALSQRHHAGGLRGQLSALACASGPVTAPNQPPVSWRLTKRSSEGTVNAMRRRTHHDSTRLLVKVFSWRNRMKILLEVFFLCWSPVSPRHFTRRCARHWGQGGIPIPPLASQPVASKHRPHPQTATPRRSTIPGVSPRFTREAMYRKRHKPQCALAQYPLHQPRSSGAFRDRLGRFRPERQRAVGIALSR